ncbi:MAG: hypothetical protein AB1650_08845 [Candidatus Omnitrophota bacterium]
MLYNSTAYVIIVWVLGLLLCILLGLPFVRLLRSIIPQEEKMPTSSFILWEAVKGFFIGFVSCSVGLPLMVYGLNVLRKTNNVLAGMPAILFIVIMAVIYLKQKRPVAVGVLFGYIFGILFVKFCLTSFLQQL